MKKSECESCGDEVESSTLKIDFLDEMSCINCARQHKYIELLENNKVPSEIKKQIDFASMNQVNKMLATGKVDHSMTSHWYDKLGI